PTGTARAPRDSRPAAAAGECRRGDARSSRPVVPRREPGHLAEVFPARQSPPLHRNFVSLFPEYRQRKEKLHPAATRRPATLGFCRADPVGLDSNTPPAFRWLTRDEQGGLAMSQHSTAALPRRPVAAAVAVILAAATPIASATTWIVDNTCADASVGD